MQELIDQINKLKKEKNAIILVHNYQRPEIYEIADHIGDSLALAQAATDTDAKILVFCGVDFMGEAAKVLNPEKKVLIPTLNAKCPLAAMINAQQVKELKQKHPNAAIVSYVNTSAEVKAESDVCCTSRNAIKIVNSLPQNKIVMIPDHHLGSYVKNNTNKEIIQYDGYCYVHSAIIPDNIKKAKLNHPDALVLAHPECSEEITKYADHVCGTGGMVKISKESDKKEFIIVTEEGMCNRLKRECPDKTFYPLAGVCFNQKFITLDLVKEALEKEQHEINVDEETRLKAKKALDRMLETR